VTFQAFTLIAAALALMAWQVSRIRADLLRGQLETERLREAFFESLKTFVDPAGDAAQKDLTQLHIEARSLLRASWEECSKITERIETFEANHQHIIDRFVSLARDPDAAPEQAAIVAYKRMEIYAAEKFLEHGRKMLHMSQNVDSMAQSIDKVFARIKLLERRLAALEAKSQERSERS
jgi:hypothetical protein